MDQGELRAADADRQRAADVLRTALNEGRLSLDEYDDRLREAYAAKTYADLDRLLTDLPQAIPTARSQVVPVDHNALVATPDAVRQWLLMIWGPWLKANAICAAIWLATAVLAGGWPFFWPVFVALPWGLVLAVMTVGGLSSGEPRKWAEKRARKRAKRAKRKAEED